MREEKASKVGQEYLLESYPHLGMSYTGVQYLRGSISKAKTRRVAGNNSLMLSFGLHKLFCVYLREIEILERNKNPKTSSYSDNHP